MVEKQGVKFSLSWSTPAC